MDNIKDIFNGIEQTDNKATIKTVDVNLSQHKRGVKRIAENFEPGFVINKTNKPILLDLLYYFTGNEKSKLDLNKGILLIGGVGTGKSLLMKIYHAYVRDILGVNSFSTSTAIEIIDSVNVSGVSFLEQFGKNIIGNKPYPKTLYVDDIASKNETVNNFGTKINVIEQLLSIRYNLFSRYGTLTHATSNKYPTEMANVYDSRIADRFKELFNFIELNGKSFRK